ncbi:hypothetical protein BDY21DRAFT_353663 [Lineolata rhizophorae]|uniref:Uncharacterized protein n=1 Tax=Lineolata rhizophorae TaxID=578093 RepID=A0A6A6NSU0_9PEZI|nr:hypothetical protein BDY21DRAFT_353663 [Lineolata rhizophorae]
MRFEEGAMKIISRRRRAEGEPVESRRKVVGGRRSVGGTCGAGSWHLEKCATGCWRCPAGQTAPSKTRRDAVAAGAIDEEPTPFSSPRNTPVAVAAVRWTCAIACASVCVCARAVGFAPRPFLYLSADACVSPASRICDRVNAAVPARSRVRPS